MAYSKEVYERALTEIKKRRENAEKTAENRKAELEEKYPDLKYINEKLGNIGPTLVQAFSSPPEEAAKILRKLRKNNAELNKEKMAILTAMGKPLDYLDIHYTCEKCSDTGFYEERDDKKGVSYGTKLCSCHVDLLKKLASEEMSMQTPLELSSFDDFDLSFYKNDEESFEQMKYVLETCVMYAKEFALKNAPNLLLYGRTGLGKTHLSLSIANEVIKKGYNVVYGSVNNFFAKIEYEKFNKGNDTYTLDLLCDADLLILDDLGMEFATSFTNSVLYTIINTRICRDLPTIISTNLSPDELRDKYHESIVSRMVGNYISFKFLGQDIRQKTFD